MKKILYGHYHNNYLNQRVNYFVWLTDHKMKKYLLNSCQHDPSIKALNNNSTYPPSTRSTSWIRIIGMSLYGHYAFSVCSHNSVWIRKHNQLHVFFQYQMETWWNDLQTLCSQVYMCVHIKHLLIRMQLTDRYLHIYHYRYTNLFVQKNHMRKYTYNCVLPIRLLPTTRDLITVT